MHFPEIKELSPLRVWLHPKRAFAMIMAWDRAISEAGEKRAEMERRHREALDAAEKRLEAQAAGSEEVRAKLAAMLEETSRALEECRRDNAGLREKLLEKKTMEDMMREVERRVDEMGEMKKVYELRIATLQKEVEDARGRLRQVVAKGGPGEIPAASTRRRPRDPASWFRTLPENI